MICDDTLDMSVVGQRLTALNATLVNDPLKADVVVVPNPGDARKSVLWVACLIGQTLVSKRFLLTGAGPAVQFAAAIQTPRLLHATVGFDQAHPRVWEILGLVLQHPESKWRLVGAARRGGVLHLVSDVVDDGRSKTRIGASRFLSSVCHRPFRTSAGICGK